MAISRRACLFGAAMAVLAKPLAEIGLEPQPYNELSVMGNIDGTLFVSVPEKLFGWMVCHGWETCDNQNTDGMIQMKLEPLIQR